VQAGGDFHSIIEEVAEGIVLACGEVEGFEDFGLGIRG
jgi:hypothetical protein